MVAQGHFALAHNALCVCFAVFIADGVCHDGIVDGCFPKMGDFNVGAKSFIVPIGEFGDARQQHCGRAKFPELIGAAIFFFIEENVGYADQCAALAGIIVQGQQLEAGIFRGAESAFDFMLVAQYLQLPGGHHEFVCHLAQMILLQDVAEDFKVLGFVHSCVFPDFIEVRENAPLACLVGNEGDTHGVNLGTKVRQAFGGVALY